MRNCGNCDYCEREAGDLVCVNDQSEYYGCFIDESHCCCDYKGDSDND